MKNSWMIMAMLAVVAALVLGLAGIADAGLTGYWPLDETAGQEVDDKIDYLVSDNGRVRDSDDKPTNIVSADPAIIGTGFDSGYNARAIRSQRSLSELGITPGGSRSVSFWGYWYGSSYRGPWFKFGHNEHNGALWSVYYGDYKGWNIWVWGEKKEFTSTAIQANKWQHWVVSYDSSDTTTRVYVDGQVRGSYVYTLSTTERDLEFAGWFASNERGYGQMDDFGVFNTALSSAEINSIRNVALEDDLNYGLDKMELLFDNFTAGTEVLIDGRLWEPFGSSAGYTGSDGALSEYQTDQFKLFLGTDVGMISSDIPPVAEPASLGLLGLALLGLRKRRN